MHFHLPKPLHGWREFFGEVGIIVVGVLLALGAEQVVESLHWRHQAAEERAVLGQEVQANLSAIQIRLVQEPCIVRRLDQVAIVLQRAKAHLPLGLIGEVGIPIPAGGSKGTWNIAVGGQVLAHMPQEEQGNYSNAFANFENWDQLRADERNAWVGLAMLNGATGLSDAEYATLRHSYEQARAADLRIMNVGPYVLHNANAGQAVPAPQSLASVFSEAGYGVELCRPLTRG
jgi:hypothetical protein